MAREGGNYLHYWSGVSREEGLPSTRQQEPREKQGAMIGEKADNK